MAEASSTSPTSFSVSVKVCHVTGCFPSPRSQRLRISSVILEALRRCWETMACTRDPSSSCSSRTPSIVYLSPTFEQILTVAPVVVRNERRSGSFGFSSNSACKYNAGCTLHVHSNVHVYYIDVNIHTRRTCTVHELT